MTNQNYFAHIAIEYMRHHYGKAFIINYCQSDDTRLCFDQMDQSGTRYIRKYLPLPNWLSTAHTVEVHKATGAEISIYDDISIHQKEKALRAQQTP